MIKPILMMLPMMVAVAFFTLMERKIMGTAHIRKGPNKVGPMGTLQPFSDALKLLSKESQKMKKTNPIMFFASPIMGLMIYTCALLTLPISVSNSNSSVAFVVLLAITSISTFFLILCGWTSNSKYSIMGSYRATAQAISYEISLILIALCPIILISSYDLSCQSSISPTTLLILMPILFVWIVSILAETNRTPFDFTEGESELVSGFNTEYSGGLFSIIFIAEYMSIIIMSVVTCSIWSSGQDGSILMVTMMTMFLFVWIRVSYPRMRYDKMMMMAWKSFLPMALAFMLLSMCTKMF